MVLLNDFSTIIQLAYCENDHGFIRHINAPTPNAESSFSVLIIRTSFTTGFILKEYKKTGNELIETFVVTLKWIRIVSTPIRTICCNMRYIYGSYDQSVYQVSIETKFLSSIMAYEKTIFPK